MYDIAIVGAGTAGLSAAIYGLRAAKTVIVFEAAAYGGQIINTPEVENYPGIQRISGFEFADNLYRQAMNLGAVLKYEKVIGIDEGGARNAGAEDAGAEGDASAGRKSDGEAAGSGFRMIRTNKGSYEARSVILATGAKNRPLGLEGETRLIGAGVSYCATCDGAFFRGKDVAVVGGGNTALEDALFLSGYCSHVYVIHRRDRFRGAEKSVARLREKDNVKFVLDSRVVGLNGEKKLESIVVEHVKTGEQRTLWVAGLFVAIGQIPDNEAFAGLVEIDSAGYVRAAEDCLTNVPGIFTAGDCRTKKVRQLATAAADGAVAALAACEFIAG